MSLSISGKKSRIKVVVRNNSIPLPSRHSPSPEKGEKREEKEGKNSDPE